MESQIAPRRPRLAVVVTDAFNLHSLYRYQFEYLMNKGFEVHAISSPGMEHERLQARGVTTWRVPMTRGIAVIQDLISLARLIRLFRRERFDVISVSTPKAGLLGSVATRFFSRSRVVYIVRGRVYENLEGWRRWLWERLEWLTCSCAQSVISISREIAEDFEERGICRAPKVQVLGFGSGNGVDLSLFTRSEAVVAEGRRIRQSIGADKDTRVLLYSGRIRAEKGINELVEAFCRLRRAWPSVKLIVQGVYEKSDPLDATTEEALFGGHEGISYYPWCEGNQVFFAAADVVVLPSYREGFGNVALEGAAMGLPVVAFDVTGCRESVVHGETGLLCEPRSVSGLVNALDRLLRDRYLRERLGGAGRERIEKYFDSRVVWERYAAHYWRLVQESRGAADSECVR